MRHATFRFLSEMDAFAGVRPSYIEDLIDDTAEAAAVGGENVEPPGPIAVLFGNLRITNPAGRSTDVIGSGDFWVQAPGQTATAMSATTYLELPDRAIDLAWEGEASRAVLADRGRIAGDEFQLVSRSVADVMVRPLVVEGHTAAQRVAEAMTLEETTAALVTEGDRLGIVTDKDFRSRMVATGRDVSGPIRDIATFPVTTIDSDERLLAALETMVDEGIKHLPVLADGRPVGMVEDIDLFGTVDESPFAVHSAVRGARDVGALAEVYASMPRVVERLLAGGMGGLAVSRLLAGFADAATAKAIEWAMADLAAVPSRYAWVSFGSLARREPALLPDQDHALVVSDGCGGQAWVERLAGGVTDLLERIGYPRCNGGVMASEPDWRGEESEWEQRWNSYLLDSSPIHLLESQIVFDSRVVAGDPSIAASFPRLRSRARTAGPFIARLAKHVLDFRPPLGFMGRLVTERSGEYAGKFDLKAGGILPIVQFARIHALVIDAPMVETIGRLEAAAASGEVSDELASVLIEGYELAMTVRLEHQVACWRNGQPLNNHIDPGELTSWRRMGLREVFKAIKSAQESLGLSYQAGLVS